MIDKLGTAIYNHYELLMNEWTRKGAAWKIPAQEAWTIDLQDGIGQMLKDQLSLVASTREIPWIRFVAIEDESMQFCAVYDYETPNIMNQYNSILGRDGCTMFSLFRSTIDSLNNANRLPPHYKGNRARQRDECKRSFVKKCIDFRKFFVHHCL